MTGEIRLRFETEGLEETRAGLDRIASDMERVTALAHSMTADLNLRINAPLDAYGPLQESARSAMTAIEALANRATAAAATLTSAGQTAAEFATPIVSAGQRAQGVIDGLVGSLNRLGQSSFTISVTVAQSGGSTNSGLGPM